MDRIPLGTFTITGAGGFVGTQLLAVCTSSDINARTVSIRENPAATAIQLPPGDVLVHLAAIAHSNDPDEERVFAINRDLAVATAGKARDTGYNHFIFLSSALVWGSGYQSVGLSTPERPDTAYGRAKLEAEERLRAIESPDFTVTILRPPLVYGPGVKGNLAKLMHAIHHWPVCPLGVPDNRRSLLHVDNLVALILHLANDGASGTFCPSDEAPCSTLEILERIASWMPRHGRVIAMPLAAQWIAQRVAPGAARRLFGSFVIHDDSVQRTGFVPPFAPDDGFEKMVRHYLANT